MRFRPSTMRKTIPTSGKQSLHVAVGLRSSIAVELPDPADLLDDVQIHFRGDELVLILAPLRQELAPRVDEVAVAVKLPDAPRFLFPHPVEAAHEVAVRDRVRRLLELPEVLREPGDGGGRVEDDLRSLQAEKQRSLGEAPVGADVDADLRLRPL